MGFASFRSRACFGIDTIPITVEVHASRGRPGFHIVGLGDTAIKEARERIRSALLNSCFTLPARRITINLAPADLPKDGGSFDLAMALGVLAATYQVRFEKDASLEFLGELALSGELRPIKQILPLVKGAYEAGHNLIISQENAFEASFIKDVTIRPASHLLDVVSHLRGHKTLSRYQRYENEKRTHLYPCLSDVHGQVGAKRSLEIAAAGGHHIIMQGAPGTGKTMLALRLPGVLPALTELEALESALVHSVARKKITWGHRPFRSPHHTLSNIAMVGGGSPPRPGEISLAHRGVLFLDELSEFKRTCIEALREPMQQEMIHIARAQQSLEFPAAFQLISAMNPCPCGYLTHPQINCRCSDHDIQRYHKKVSGPMLDRIDLHITLDSTDYNPGVLQEGETSAVIQKRVKCAREIQFARQHLLNSRLGDRALAERLQLGSKALSLIKNAMKKMNLSSRSANKVLRISRTIADLENSEAIHEHHLLESLGYRISLDREN